MIKHPGDTEWLVNFLAIADEDDEIFDRKYKYVRPKSKIAEVMFDNTDGFWNDLPPLTERQIKSSNRLRLSKEQRFEQALDKLSRQKSALIE